jgi:hypothetical protein
MYPVYIEGSIGVIPFILNGIAFDNLIYIKITIGPGIPWGKCVIWNWRFTSRA